MYLMFWGLGYKPGESVNRFKGLTLAFFLMTAIAGIAGTGCTIAGMNSLKPVTSPVLPGWLICITGIVLYFILLLITDN